MAYLVLTILYLRNYKEINKLEKTEVEEKKYYNYEEKYRPLILIAGLLLLLELLLRNTIFRSFV